jgi:hypothetical protein
MEAACTGGNRHARVADQARAKSSNGGCHELIVQTDAEMGLGQQAYPIGRVTYCVERS